MIKNSIKKPRTSTSPKNRRDNRRPVSPRPPQNNVIIGVIEKHLGKYVVVAHDTRYVLSTIREGDIHPVIGNLVKARLHNAGKNKWTASIIRVLPPKLSLKERIDGILHDAKVRQEFPEPVIKEAEAFPEKVKKGNRVDLCGYALCTIDGESAKDFDDAVFAQEKGKNIEVIVAIADVSAYVTQGSALDEEAFLRATSIYYPGSCIPMLPESLSNGLCSLKPKVLRLSLAVSFEVSKKGVIQKPKIFEAVIKSAARLTYNQVQNFYDTSKAPFSSDVKKSLSLLKDAAHLIRKTRQNRGAIDFDLIESVVALDDVGEPIAIHPQDRLDSHRIIEDLMVATNEVVATLFAKKNWPCIYRVHEPPDQEKLGSFLKSAQAFQALKPKTKASPEDVRAPKDLQMIMADYQKSRYASILNNLMLRAMMQARYSESNLKHFGLASDAYLHFTSPIRRYADLMVHRQLRYLLFEKKTKKKISEEVMQKVSAAISDKEAKATELERKIDRVYAATFMSAHIGETFEAIIASCTEFGMFVRIVLHHVEGLVHISAISRNHVNFMPERMSMVVSGSKESYTVGDKVLVKLVNVNVDRGHIDFELVKSSSHQEQERKSRDKNHARRY